MFTNRSLTIPKVFLLTLSILSACKENGNPVSSDGFPVEPGPILFISDKSGTYQLYSMNEDGSNVQQLTNDPNFPILDAKWSPDGKKIAVVSLVGDEMTYPRFRNAIFVMDADGRNRYQLTPQWFYVEDPTYGRLEYGGAYSPAWSPDSKQIAYSRLLVPETLGHYDIFICRVNGSDERRLKKQILSAEIVTDWLKNGESLAGFTWNYNTVDSAGHSIEDTRIVVLDLYGNIVKTFGQLGSTYSWPKFSYGGEKILFNSNDYNTQDIYIMDSSGNDKVKLTNGLYKYTSPVSWSPDEAQILFNGGNGDALGRPFGIIGVANVQSKNIMELTPFKGSAYSYATSWRR